MELKPSPCELCPQQDKCHRVCEFWEAWFKESWRKLRREILGRRNHG